MLYASFYCVLLLSESTFRLLLFFSLHFLFLCMLTQLYVRVCIFWTSVLKKNKQLYYAHKTSLTLEKQRWNCSNGIQTSPNDKVCRTEVKASLSKHVRRLRQTIVHRTSRVNLIMPHNNNHPLILLIIIVCLDIQK